MTGQRGPTGGLAEAWGSLRHDLALREASGEPAGRGPSRLGLSHRRELKREVYPKDLARAKEQYLRRELEGLEAWLNKGQLEESRNA